MMASIRTPPTPAVHIVLDTNALFTQHEAKLLAEELSGFITAHAKNIGLKATYYIPHIVKLERQAHMYARAKQLLPNVRKIEQLLGHKLNITDEIVNSRVDEVIAKEIAAHGLVEMSIDYAAIDWPLIANCAAHRLPPFSPGETEKGFKDVLVAEAFFQLVGTLPKSPGHARMVLLTGDSVLGDAVRERAKGWSNVQVVDDLSSLRTMMTALASHLSDDAVREILPKAEKMFFAVGKDECLYHKWEIAKLLNHDGVNLSGNRKSGFKYYKTDAIYINKPSISAKSGQKISFNSNVEIEFEDVEFVPRLSVHQYTNALSSPGGASGWDQHLASANAFQPNALSPNPYLPSVLSSGAFKPNSLMHTPSPQLGLLGGLRSPDLTQMDQIKRGGRHLFRVEWSATLTQTGSLARAALGEVVFDSTTWAD